MSTTSTYPIVVAALVDLIDGNPAAPAAFESWPGPDAVAEMVVFGGCQWEQYAVATIKAGRKQRQEEYTILAELFVMGAEGSSPARCAPVRAKAFELLAPIEDALAEDVTGGTDFFTVQHIQLHPRESGPHAFEDAWAYRIEIGFAVAARLL